MVNKKEIKTYLEMILNTHDSVASIAALFRCCTKCWMMDRVARAVFWMMDRVARAVFWTFCEKRVESEKQSFTGAKPACTHVRTTCRDF